MRIFLKFGVSIVLIVCWVSLAHGQAMDGATSSSKLVSFCASARETDTDMNITIREDGSISGEFFMSECGSGPLFGYAQISAEEREGSGEVWWGKLFIYTDILGGCSIPGAFYSVDVPDLLYRWQAGGGGAGGAALAEEDGGPSVKAAAVEPYRSGAGILELLECGP